MTTPSGHTEPEPTVEARFHLTLPARTEHLQLVRLTVAALASDRLTVDEIEDVKVAIEELTALVMAPDGEPDVHLEFALGTSGLRVVGTRRLDADNRVVTHDFLDTILDAVCDSHVVGDEPGSATFEFEKLAREG